MYLRLRESAQIVRTSVDGGAVKVNWSAQGRAGVGEYEEHPVPASKEVSHRCNNPACFI